MVVVKILSKDVTIITVVLLEINLIKRTWELKEKDINYFTNWNIAMKS